MSAAGAAMVRWTSMSSATRQILAEATAAVSRFGHSCDNGAGLSDD
jgi:hypothetical protein